MIRNRKVLGRMSVSSARAVREAYRRGYLAGKRTIRESYDEDELQNELEDSILPDVDYVYDELHNLGAYMPAVSKQAAYDLTDDFYKSSLYKKMLKDWQSNDGSWTIEDLCDDYRDDVSDWCDTWLEKYADWTNDDNSGDDGSDRPGNFHYTGR